MLGRGINLEEEVIRGPASLARTIWERRLVILNRVTIILAKGRLENFSRLGVLTKGVEFFQGAGKEAQKGNLPLEFGKGWTGKEV